MTDAERLIKTIVVRMTPEQKDRVIAKVQRESVNLSALVRSWLRLWVGTETKEGERR